MAGRTSEVAFVLFLSVVIPTRNERETIAACLDSLLAQNYPADRFEIVVVEGNSTDGTREIVSRYPVRLFKDGGGGCAAARNIGLREARGDVVAFLDADCTADARWLSVIAERFLRDASLAGLGGALRNQRTGCFFSKYADLHSMRTYRGFITSNVAYRREILVEVGGFDPTLVCGEDWDLWWRILDRGERVVFEPRAIVEHAPPENRESREYLKKQFWYARMDVRLFARRFESVLERLAAREYVATREPWRILRGALVQASAPAGLLLAPVAPGVGAGLGAIFTAWCASQAMRAQEKAPGDAEFAEAFAYYVIKGLARGSGTVAGSLDVLLQSFASPVHLRRAEARESFTSKASGAVRLLLESGRPVRVAGGLGSPRA